MIKISTEEILDICAGVMIVALSVLIGLAIFGTIESFATCDKQETTPGTAGERGE